MLSLLLAMTLANQTGSTSPGRGISEALAQERAAAIRALRYDISFIVPPDLGDPVQGRAIVRFTLAAPHRIVFDFAEPRDRVRSVRVAGRDVPFDVAEGHISLATAATRAGANEIEIEFVAGDAALNRNDEFLYTLFVPARAHRTFPVFD